MYKKLNANTKGWPWNPTHLVLDRTLYYNTGKRGVNFTSPDGLFKVVDGVFECYPGIEWDGTTSVPDGGADPDTPQYPLTWKASLIHDQVCKYTRESREFRKLYNRADGDWYFYTLLKDAGYRWAEVYYLGVRFWSIVSFFTQIKKWFKREKRG